MRISIRICLWICPVLMASASMAKSPDLNTTVIEQVTGLKGTFNTDENVFKVTKPRTDVKAVVDGWAMPAFMGLTSWAAFTPAHDGLAMMMGDTVLFEDEVNPAMSVALEAGLEVTALHNHFFFGVPKVYFMHIGGMGDTAKLAAGVKKIYDKIAEIRATEKEPQNLFAGTGIGATNAISLGPLEAALGAKGQAKDGMFKIVIGRKSTMHGVTVAEAMGVNTWAAFAGTDDQAVVDGDIAMIEDELQVVLKAMRNQGINIVAIHNHMTHEEPRYIFLHYWGKGPAISLAKSLRTVLDAQAAVPK